MGLLNSYLHEIVLRNITELNIGVKILIGFNFVFGIRLCLDVDEDAKALNGSLHFFVVCFALFLFLRICLLFVVVVVFFFLLLSFFFFSCLCYRSKLNSG